MTDYIAYIIVRALNKILGCVPITVSLWIGRRLGGLAFIFNKKRRLIAYANFKAAFAKEKSPSELRRITKRVYQNLVETFMEVLSLTKVDKAYVDKYIEIINYERVEKASESGRGTILLTAHFGDWELSSLVGGVKGFPILVLAREQRMKRLNELLNRLRESKGCRVIRKGISTKNLFRALYEKQIVGILSDQDAGRTGIFVDFFGRPTSTAAGPMEMARRTDSLILPNFIVRKKGPYHRLILEELIDFRDSKSDGEDVKRNLQKFANLLESYVRRYPEQWLWLHKRWKSTPIRTILVLNDGRQGHLSQSLAVARQIQVARTTQGYKLDDTKVVIVDVRFKNKFLRNILSMCTFFSTWRCHGCMRCMKFCLEPETYETLMKTYSEFVISCGSRLAAVNIFMAKENNAKNVVIMKPNIVRGLNKFNLAIISEHDVPPRARNVVATRLAPNLMTEDELKSAGQTLRKYIGIVRDSTIGLLIGGDNPEFSLTKEAARKVIEDLLKFCEEDNVELLVTTSRRTPPDVEEALKNKLANNPRCKLLVIANEKNLDEAVAGILDLSKVIVVSGDSISMISEAISSGRKTVAFKLEKKIRALTKHETALKDLEREGYLITSTIQELHQAVKRAWEEDRPLKDINDREKIFEAVRRLI